MSFVDGQNEKSKDIYYSRLREPFLYNVSGLVDCLERRIFRAHSDLHHAGGIVGVDFFAEPLSYVGARQHAPVFPACRKPRSAADRHNGKSFGRYGGFFFSEYKKRSPLSRAPSPIVDFLWKSMIRTGGP